MPIVNPRLSRLQPYPFERLRQLFAGVAPNPALAPINLSIGEPRHPTPALVLDALAAGLPAASRIIPRRSARPRCARRSPRGSPAGTGSAPGSGNAGAARAGKPRSAVRVRADGDRRQPRRRHRRDAESVLPDLRRRRVACRRRAVLRERGSGERFRAGVARGARRDLGQDPARLRLLAGQPDRPRHDGRRMGIPVRDGGPPRLRHRGRRVLFRDPLRRGAAARSERSPWRTRWAAPVFPRLVSFGSLSKRSNAPGFARGTSPATPRC